MVKNPCFIFHYLPIAQSYFLEKKTIHSICHSTCPQGEGLPPGHAAASLRRPADDRCGEFSSAACGPAPGDLRGAGGGAGEEGGERKESGGDVGEDVA